MIPYRKIQTVIRFCTAGVITSALILILNAIAYYTGNIPDYMLPLVKWLSGSQECIPIAYAWIARLVLLGIFVFTMSLTGLVFVNIPYVRKKVEQAGPGYPPQGVGSPDP